MKASSSFQFNPSKFLARTAHLSPEGRGAYISLLCFQWENGFIPADAESRKRIVGGTYSEDLLDLFDHDENGRLIDKELEEIRERQQRFIESQRLKGQASGRSRRKTFNRGSTGVQETNRGSISVEPNDIEYSVQGGTTVKQRGTQGGYSKGGCVPQTEPGVEPPSGWPKSESEAIAAAEMAGVPREFATTEYNRAVGRGYKDAKGNRVHSWRHFVKACHDTFRSIQTEKTSAGGNGQQSDKNYWKLKSQLDLVCSEIKAIEDRAPTDAMGSRIIEPQDRENYPRLKQKRKELKKELGIA